MNDLPPKSDFSNLIARLNLEMDDSVRRSKDLIRSVVGEGCQRIHSAESSFLVPSEGGTHLSFLVSVNPVLETENPTVPIDGSIAGYVFTTGQLMAVSDVAEEAPDLHYRQIDEKTGLHTQSYMAVPVMRGEDTAAVLTFVNRTPQAESASFSAEELNLAQTYAEIAGIAYVSHQNLLTQQFQAAQSLEEVFSPKGPRHEDRSFSPAPAWERLIALLQTFPESDRGFLLQWLEMFSQYRLSISLGRDPNEEMRNE